MHNVVNILCQNNIWCKYLPNSYTPTSKVLTHIAFLKSSGKELLFAASNLFDILPNLNRIFFIKAIILPNTASEYEGMGH